MLDVIGAGATSKTNWHNVWILSNECKALEDQLQKILYDGRKRPPVETQSKSDFSTTWLYQLYSLTKRGYKAYHRNPTYVMAKLLLNIAGGLFIGFTFWNAKNTLQGTQDKIFVSDIFVV